jgi:hypothetical protein
LKAKKLIVPGVRPVTVIDSACPAARGAGSPEICVAEAQFASVMIEDERRKS